MKRALTLLLAVTMLLTMLSMLAVTPAVAEEPATRTPLNVTFHSASENYCICDDCKKANITTPVDWSYYFDRTTNTRKFARVTSDYEIIGKFDQPTEITSVVFDCNFYPSRMNGLNIQFSTDGVNWPVGYTLQEDNTKQGRQLIEIPTPYDNTKYSYVRLHMSKKMNANYIESDIYWVAFYNEAAKADRLIEGYLHKVTSVDGFENAEKFFDLQNTKLLNTKGTTAKDYIVEGKLEYPTVISDVFVKYENAYMNNTKINASVDGVNWVNIVSMGGIWANASNSSPAKVAHFHVKDTTAYNYVQIVRDHGLWDGNWKAYGIGFVGEEVLPATSQMLNVTYQSSSASKCNCSTCANTADYDWSYIFNRSATTVRHSFADDEDAWVIGKFDQPTKITSMKINCKYQHWLLGMSIQFSTNGTDWDVGYALQEHWDNKAADYAKEKVIEINFPGDSTEYQYVRLYHTAKTTSAGTLNADIAWVAFYNDTAKADQLIEANLEKILTTAEVTNAEAFFNYSNTTTSCMVKGNVKPDNLFLASFDKPTALTDIYIRHEVAAINGTYIEASVDGETWTKVATFGSHWGNINRDGKSDVAHARVLNDKTYYNYVRVVRDQNYSNWNAYSIGFVGEEMDLCNSLKYQTKIEETEWALRLITTVDSLDFEAVGYEITATSPELAEAKFWDRNTESVYTSIYENVDGKEEIRDAAYCGGKYIFTAVISDISIEEYSEITFVVKPYVLVNGAKVYGATETIVLNDGVAA